MLKTTKIWQKYSYRCNFTSQIAFANNLRAPKTQSFVEEHAPKTQILDRTLSSQNMRGQTAHNRPSSSNPVGEKGDVLYLKTSIQGDLTSSFRHPMIHLQQCCTFLRGWGLTDTSITSLLHLMELFESVFRVRQQSSDDMYNWTLQHEEKTL